MNEERYCERCGAPMPAGKRRDARWCGDACGREARRERERASAGAGSGAAAAAPQRGAESGSGPAAGPSCLWCATEEEAEYVLLVLRAAEGVIARSLLEEVIRYHRHGFSDFDQRGTP